jgi:hypothetical protein
MITNSKTYLRRDHLMMAIRYHLQIFRLLTLLILVGSPLVSAQESPHHNTTLYWANTGLGGSSFGWAGGASFSIQPGNSILSVRYIRNEENVLSHTSPMEVVWDIAALYGRCFKGTDGFASISGGFSLIGGVERGEFLYSRGAFFPSRVHRKLTFTNVGIPLEAQCFWTPLSFLGIGLYGFANLNYETSFGGILLCAQFGKLKNE